MYNLNFIVWISSFWFYWTFSLVTIKDAAVMILSGALLPLWFMPQASIFLFASCFSFWTVKTDNLRNMIFFNARRFSGYPISFYPGIIQKLLMFVIPFAFVNYFPAQFYLNKAEINSFWNGFLYLSPAVGAIMFVLVYMFWRQGVRHYSSTGTSR